MFCHSCGAELSENSKFCGACGMRVPAPSNPQSAPQQTSGAYASSEPDPFSSYTPAPDPFQTSTPTSDQTSTASADSASSSDSSFTTPSYGSGSYQAPYQSNANMFETPQKKPKSCCLRAFLYLVLGFVGLIVVLVALLYFAADWILDEDFLADSSITTDGVFDSTESYSAQAAGDSHWDTDKLRDYYTTIYDDGSDQVTLLVYMIGSDLESDGGYASDDLAEMLSADFDDNLNLVVMTGGATRWHNSNISSRTCQYWQIENGELVALNNDVGLVDMTQASTLTNFIDTATDQFPANRYALILWDHGGGTLSGFGYDENYPNGEMALDDIATALDDADVHFDFVGFDACLMGSMEVAMMLEPYSDYMIASEEIIECTGWYYPTFLEAWSQDPSLPTVDMATILINSFVEATVADYRWGEATLSIIDLREIPATHELMVDYFDDVEFTVDSSSYTDLSWALSNAKAFGEGDYEQIDLIDLVTKMNLEGTQTLVNAVSSAVKYTASSDTTQNANGLSLYFPYSYPEYYAETSAMMSVLGFDADYTDFLGQYVSATVGEYTQYATYDSGFAGGSGSSGGSNGGGGHDFNGGGGLLTDFSTQDWYDAETANAYADAYDNSDYEDLYIELKGDEYVLHLSDKQWDSIDTIELQVMLDDGTGYVVLGSDNVYEFDRDGDLIVAFDYTWVTLDGHTVPFYAVDEVYLNDRDWYTYGVVPALLNDSEYVEVVVYWDSEQPQGYVTGYRKYTESGDPMGKGTFPLHEGDTLDWLFDYYSYNDEYDPCYLFGQTYRYDGGEIQVSYDYVGDWDAIAYFELTDIHQRVYYSEAVSYTDP